MRNFVKDYLKHTVPDPILAAAKNSAQQGRSALRYTIREGSHPSDVTTGSPAWEHLARLTKELCTGVRNNESLVVLKTPPGAAQYFGSAIDLAGSQAILGTIAGDDTIVIICASGIRATDMAEAFRSMAESGTPAPILATEVPSS